MEEKKQRCKKCNTPLSMYNKGEYCFSHTEGMLFVKHVPVTGCTSRTIPKGESMDVPKPGTEEHHNLAYTREITGVYIDGETLTLE